MISSDAYLTHGHNMSFSTAQMENNRQCDSKTLPLLHRMQLTPIVPQQAISTENMSTLKMRMACNNSNQYSDNTTTHMPVEIKILNTERDTQSSEENLATNNEAVTVTYNNAKDFAANYFANKVQVANTQLNHEHVHEALNNHKLHVENLVQQSNYLQNEQTLHAEALLDHKTHTENHNRQLALHAEALLDHKTHTEKNNRALDKLTKSYGSLHFNVDTHTHQITQLKNMIQNTNKAVSQHKHLIEKNLTVPNAGTRAWS